MNQSILQEMRKHNLVLILILTILVNACKKNDDTVLPDTSSTSTHTGNTSTNSNSNSTDSSSTNANWKQLNGKIGIDVKLQTHDETIFTYADFSNFLRTTVDTTCTSTSIGVEGIMSVNVFNDDVYILHERDYSVNFSKYENNSMFDTINLGSSYSNINSAAIINGYVYTIFSNEYGYMDSDFERFLGKAEISGSEIINQEQFCYYSANNNETITTSGIANERLWNLVTDGSYLYAETDSGIISSNDGENWSNTDIKGELYCFEENVFVISSEDIYQLDNGTSVFITTLPENVKFEYIKNNEIIGYIDNKQSSNENSVDVVYYSNDKGNSWTTIQANIEIDYHGQQLNGNIETLALNNKYIYAGFYGVSYYIDKPQ